MSTYIIYTRSGCPCCEQAKFLISRERTPFIVINCDEMLKTDRQAFITEMRKKTKNNDN